MLQVESVSRSYGEFKAVDQVSFSVERGEVVGLLGHNGAGKTTIMKMLSGFLEPDEGSIHFKGESVTESPQPLQRELGYLPEHLPVYPELSVASYLDYAASLKGLSGADKRQELRRVIEATDLGDRLLAPIATLSRGLKQRVGVAQAILGKPSLLILDEPTNGLDPAQTESMRQLIKQISDTATVILSTHIMQEVEAVCDRALIIRRGQLVVDERLGELTHSNRILFSTTADEARVRQAIESLSCIERVEQCAVDQQGLGHWYLTVAAGEESHSAIAQCATAMVQQSIPVMQLRSDEQTLQSLFLQVTENSTETAREVEHVA